MGGKGAGSHNGPAGAGQGYPPSTYGPTAQQYGQTQGLDTTRGRPTGYTKQSHDIGSGPKPKYRSRKKSQWQLLKVFVVAVILVLIFNLIPFNTLISAREFLMTDMTEGMPREFPARMDYQMTRQLAMGIAGGTLNYQLKVPAPEDLAEEQQISVESNLPFAQSGDYMTWSGSVTDSDVTVILNYQITAYSKKWDVRPEEVGGKVPSKYDIYLDDEWIITPSEDRVQVLAKKITVGKTNKMDQAEALFTWMKDNIKYNTGRNWKPQTPDQTLDAKQGDCDDQSVLYASMSRYLGIPAWLEMGALYDKSINKWGGHAWLIVYLPTKDGKGIMGNVDMANHEFMFRDSYRFTEWIDDGDANNLRDFYNLWSYSTNGMGQVKDATNIYITDKVTESPDQVSERRTDQGLKSWKDTSWKVPGFEGIALVSALMATVLILTIRTRISGIEPFKGDAGPSNGKASRDRKD